MVINKELPLGEGVLIIGEGGIRVGKLILVAVASRFVEEHAPPRIVAELDGYGERFDGSIAGLIFAIGHSQQVVRF